MLQSYENMVRTCYAPLIKQYDLEFAAYDNDEFFMIGNGFALYAFVDRRDRRGDTWYVSLNQDGAILVHTLMYISKERFTQQDRAVVGKIDFIDTSDEYIEATFKVKCVGFLNHCHDILSGDTQWLQSYPGKGNYSRHVALFLAPYFQRQGHYVKLMEETLD
jgi:hypothetical protein